MKQLIPILLLPALAACATPRDSCFRQASKDLNVVDDLIQQTQQNLQRGYAVQQQPYVTSTVDVCWGGGPFPGPGPGFGWNYCNQPTTTYREVPVAIDTQAEKRKLAELQQTRARLQKETNSRIAQCDGQYPLK